MSQYILEGKISCVQIVRGFLMTYLILS